MNIAGNSAGKAGENFGKFVCKFRWNIVKGGSLLTECRARFAQNFVQDSARHFAGSENFACQHFVSALRAKLRSTSSCTKLCVPNFATLRSICIVCRYVCAMNWWENALMPIVKALQLIWLNDLQNTTFVFSRKARSAKTWA